MAVPSPERVSALTEIDRVFSLATLDYPQSAPGVPRIAAAQMRLIAENQLTAEQVTRVEIGDDPTRVRKVIALTSAVHNLFAAPGNEHPGSANLAVAVPFAYGLVRSAVMAGSRGIDGQEAGSLEMPTDEEVAQFSDFAADPAKVEQFRKITARAANVAHAAGGLTEEIAAEFRNQLLVNNDQLVVGYITREEHFANRTLLQANVGRDIGDIVVRDITANPIEGVNTGTAALVVHNMLETPVGPSIPGRYFGPPPQS